MEKGSWAQARPAGPGTRTRDPVVWGARITSGLDRAQAGWPLPGAATGPGQSLIEARTLPDPRQGPSLERLQQWIQLPLIRAGDGGWIRA
jgi:hypothetical protein